MPSMPQRFINKLFRNKDGQIVIGQSPNLPILAWFGFMLSSHLLKHGRWQTGSHMTAQAFLFTWAYLEIRSGASLFRRLLGGLVVALVLISFFRTAL